MTSVDGLSDPLVAIRLRDAIVKRVITVLDNERPPYQYGTVTAINPDQRQVYVQFPGAPEPVPVNTGAIIPSSVGVTVRVAGRVGDRYIADVMGAAFVADPNSNDVEAPTDFLLDGGIGVVTAHWTPVEGVTKYRLLLAEDEEFTVNVRQYDLVNSVFTENNLNPGQEVWGKVAALTNGGPGLYSAVDSAVVEDWPIPPPTDGEAPAYSPDPVVTSGIGFLMAEWVPVPNSDPVTYRVYGDYVSGFAADASTYLGQVTDSSFFFIRRDANGDPLIYDQNFFVRLIAGDQDGDAPASAQGFAAADQVQTGDVGRIDTSLIHDGLLPPQPLTPPVVTSGIGYLYVQWDHVINEDPVMYEVHLSSTNGFLPGANTLIGETPSNRFFARNVGPGAGGGPLQYGVTYYVKIRPKDADGTADPGPQGAGFTVQAATIDLATGAITAASGIIADAAIGSAKIQDASITNLKVADAAISSAKIQDLAVGTAKIADAAIATAKIGDLQVTNAKINDLSVGKLTAGTINAQEIILSNSTASILRSSNFSPGSSGWRVRGNGDAEFSNVTVRGTVESSDINGSTITGGTFRTATSGARVVIDQSTQERIKFYDSGGSLVGTLGYRSGGWGAGLYLTSPVKVIISDEAGSTGAGHLSVYQLTMNNMTGETIQAYTQITSPSIRVNGNNVIHAGNIGSQSVSYANNAGSASSAGSAAGLTGTVYTSGGRLYISTSDEATTAPSAQVLTSGQVRRTTGTSTIDVKENVRPLTRKHKPNDILKLKAVAFDYKMKPGKPIWNATRMNHLGFVAEEVEQIIPELVERDQGEPIVRYDKIAVLLLPVIQKIVEKIGGIDD